MDRDKEQIVLSLIAQLELAFDKELMPSQRAIYLEGIGSYQPEALSQAIDTAIKSEQKFPTVAKLRELANIYRIPISQQLPRYSLHDVKPDSELGKECMANIISLYECKIDKREFLITAQRICDKYGEESDWINEQWQF